LCHGTVRDGGDRIVVRVDARVPPEVGSTVHVRIRPDEHHVFSATTGLRLGT
jgi:multiple sugar transport system ATP-binding protein